MFVAWGFALYVFEYVRIQCVIQIFGDELFITKKHVLEADTRRETKTGPVQSKEKNFLTNTTLKT